jgi:hypothetical protein
MTPDMERDPRGAIFAAPDLLLVVEAAGVPVVLVDEVAVVVVAVPVGLFDAGWVEAGDICKTKLLVSSFKIFLRLDICDRQLTNVPERL